MKAYQIANKSDSKLLHALVAPFNALIGQADRLRARLKKGQYSEADLRTLTDGVNAFGKQAARNGFTIKDVPTPAPAQRKGGGWLSQRDRWGRDAAVLPAATP